MFTTFTFNNTADYTTCLQHLSLITLQIIPHVYNIWHFIFVLSFVSLTITVSMFGIINFFLLLLNKGYMYLGGLLVLIEGLI